jgi:putative ABC transport system substrate-binding protein
MRRRDVLGLLGGAAVSWPVGAATQQQPLPVIGYLTARAPGDDPHLIAAFREGLKDNGFVEGQNVEIEYRFAAHQNERLPTLAPIWFAVRSP